MQVDNWAGGYWPPNPFDGALYGVEQGQGIPQLVSRRCTLELMTRRSGRNRLRNEHQNPRIAKERASRGAGGLGKAS